MYSGLTAAQKAAYRAGAVQTVSVTGTGISLSGADIWQGGFSIDRKCTSGGMIEMGSAVASELSVKLANTDGRLDGTVFEGKELYVELALADDPSAAIPLGYFTVDGTPKRLDTISLVALDRMASLDVPAGNITYTQPYTPKQVIKDICDHFGYGYSISAGVDEINGDYGITTLTTDGRTARQLLMDCIAVMGCCAYFDGSGNLVTTWFRASGETVAASDRFSLDMDEKDITVTGYRFTDADGTVHLAGTAAYALDLSANQLLLDNPAGADACLNNLLVKRGLTSRPFSTGILPRPWLEPLDTVTVTDRHGQSVTCAVTGVTVVMNSLTALSGAGLTAQEMSYAPVGGVTPAQRVEVRQVASMVAAAQAEVATAFSQMISGGMGMHSTKVDGRWYYHDGESLADSRMIATFNSNGFGWTDDWNGGSPEWTYGMTRDGNAIVNRLSAFRLDANQIDVDNLFAQNITATGRIYGAEIHGADIQGASGTVGGFTMSYTREWVEGEPSGITSYTDNTDMVYDPALDAVTYSAWLTPSHFDWSSDIMYTDLGVLDVDTWVSVHLPAGAVHDYSQYGLAFVHLQFFLAKKDGSRWENVYGSVLEVPFTDRDSDEAESDFDGVVFGAGDEVRVYFRVVASRWYNRRIIQLSFPLDGPMTVTPHESSMTSGTISRNLTEYGAEPTDPDDGAVWIGDDGVQFQYGDNYLKIDESGIRSSYVIGAITAFGGSAAPTGWLMCDGAAVSRTTYAALFAVIGTAYGSGNGSTTFNLPNLQDRFPMGASTYARGATGGSAGAWRHSHSTVSHSHSANSGFQFSEIKIISGRSGKYNMATGSGRYGYASSSSYDDITSSGSTAAASPNTNASGSTGNTLSADVANLPPYQAVNYIICTGV